MDQHSWILLREAAKLNTAGVESFASGYSELAIKQLNSALILINKLLLMHCDQYDLSSRFFNTLFQDPNFIRTTIERERDDLLLNVRPANKEFSHLQDEKFYVYNQALLFTPPTPAQYNAISTGSHNSSSPFAEIYFGNYSFLEIRTCYIQVSYFWSIIHFNMALVLHRLIQETADNNKRYRDEAVLFYKLCLQNLWVIPASSPTMNLLMLCTVNNLAHVYLNLHDDSCLGVAAATDLLQVIPLLQPSLTNEALAAMSLPCYKQTKLIQGLLLRAIGKVISNDRNLTPEQHDQVTEMSVNHIVISALRPCYVAAGA